MRAVTLTTTPNEITRPAMGCPRCRAPMRELALPSHKGATVTVEQCAGCRLVWFDRFESVHLDAIGWVRLLREMEGAAKRPLSAPQVDRPACPICAGRLNPVQNQTRFGLFAALECRQGHGHLHSHSGLLAERGLVRPLGVAERRALAQEKLALHCLNCGGPAEAGANDCSYCGTALVVLDLPRLAHSLRPRAELMAASPRALGRHAVWPCRGCGAPLDPGRETHCSRCGHVVVVHGLPDIDPLLDAAEAELSELAAAEVRRLARYPSTHSRPARATPPPPETATSRWVRALMLGGWAPLMLMLAAALVLIEQAFIGAEGSAGTPQQALREQRLARAPGSGWIWLEAHRLLRPNDREGRAALRGALFDVHLRQLADEPLPATLTVGQLLDGTLPHPAALADRNTAGRWDRLLAGYLKPLPGTADMPQTDETHSSHDRWAPAAPGVWIETERRAQALWALNVENTGPVVWRVGRLSMQVKVEGLGDLRWRCQPASGADPVLVPHGHLALICRPTVAPSDQEERWRAAMGLLQGGISPQMAWNDETLATGAGFDAMTDRWATEAARGSARLDTFLRGHTELRRDVTPLKASAEAVRAEAPPALSLRERWTILSDSGRHTVMAAGALITFVVFCAFARGLGERRAIVGSLLVAAAASYWAGRGEGAASVLLVAMYVSLSAIVVFALAFGFHFYRDSFFRR